MTIKKSSLLENINLDEVIKEFIVFCLRENPKNLTEVFSRFFYPRKISKSQALKILKLMRTRGLCYYSVYSNVFVLTLSTESLKFLSRLDDKYSAFSDFSAVFDLRSENINGLNKGQKNHDQA